MHIFDIKKTDDIFPFVKAIEKYPMVSVIRLSGSFDFKTIPPIEDAAKRLKEHFDQNIILDFKEVTHIDTSTLAVLIYIMSKLKQQHKELYLININDTIGEQIRITRLEPEIQVYNTLEDVLREIKKE